MIQVYLLRHGIAERKAPSSRDADRPLTMEGKIQVQKNAGRLAELGVTPSLILSSPYLRALQTARAAAEVLGYKGTILETRALTPDADPAELWSEIRDHAEAPSLLLVTHEPLVSSALAWLTGETHVAEPFVTAGLARVDFEEMGAVPRGTLLWMLKPNL